jgi:hypothetical protein
VQAHPEENRLKNIKEGLSMIATAETVMYVDESMLKNYFKSRDCHSEEGFLHGIISPNSLHQGRGGP